MANASDQLPDGAAVIVLPVDEVAIRLLRSAAFDQQGHLLSRSNAAAPTYWPKQITGDQATNRAFLRAITEAWDWLRYRGLIAVSPTCRATGRTSRRAG